MSADIIAATELLKCLLNSSHDHLAIIICVTTAPGHSALSVHDVYNHPWLNSRLNWSLQGCSANFYVCESHARTQTWQLDLDATAVVPAVVSV